MTTPEPTRYDSWAQVPPNSFLTKSRLSQLSFPRRPGPVRATVNGTDGIGRKAVIDLHLISESTPSNATSAQLAAAAHRQHPHRYTCTQCGARPDLPTEPPGDGVRLCQACAHIWHLRDVQRQAAEERTRVRDQAAELVDDPRTVIIHTTFTDRGTTDAGAKRPPSAAHITALDTTGRAVLDLTVRLVGPRAQGIPEGAIDPAVATETIREALAERHLVLWNDTNHSLASVAAAFPTGYGVRHDLHLLTLRWRGDIDPHTGRQRPVVSPGRADRMLLLLKQIADAP